jgi:hypothetical protein
VVDRARQHPRQLGGAHPVRQGGEERLGFGDRGVVLLRGAELEEDLGVVDVAPELLERLDGLLEGRSTARQRLRLLGVVPEAGGERLFAEALDLFFQLREVKGAPLAP